MNKHLNKIKQHRKFPFFPNDWFLETQFCMGKICTFSASEQNHDLEKMRWCRGTYGSCVTIKQEHRGACGPCVTIRQEHRGACGPCVTIKQEHRHFKLAKAFTSQGGLFVFWAKSPRRGDSWFHFSFQTEAAGEPLPHLQLCLHSRKKLLISWDKSFIKERNGALVFLGEPEKQWRRPTSHGKRKEKDSNSFWGFAWLIRHVDSSCFLDRSLQLDGFPYNELGRFSWQVLMI